MKINRDLLILDEFEFFYFFFIVTSNFKNSMYPRSFLCEKAKIKRRTFSKKQRWEIGEEVIWGPNSHPFAMSFTSRTGGTFTSTQYNNKYILYLKLYKKNFLAITFFLINQ